MTSETFFDCTGIKPVRLADWLDTACHGNNGSKIPRIVLPMIQRGSVWKPHQVMDLWDTLLRGMPVGSMMASVVTSDQAINPLTRELEDVSAENPALGLLDGQQRTLAMLLAWPTAPDDIERRIWIDMGDKPPVDKLFRYHFTTKNQPFGFERAGPGGQAVGKLSRNDRRKALEAAKDLPSDFEARRTMLWANSRPFHGIVPINLREILKWRNDHHALRDYVHEMARRTGHDVETQLASNLDRLLTSLKRFEELYLPIINVPNQHFDVEEDGPSGEVHDPALAVLFQRIGTALSNADYVFSVIKHHSKECHSLVETALEKNKNIAALFAPVSLVTTAVRLTAAQIGAPDYAKIEKQQFARLMNPPKISQPEPDRPSFLVTFTENIGTNGAFLKSLATLLNAIRYQGGKFDIGLPKHALCLIDVRVLEAMLLWMQRNGASAVDPVNRKRLIRFAIYWRLAVIDQDKADRKVFEFLKGNPGMPAFPDEELVRLLVDASLALPMVAPETYEDDKDILAKVIRCPEPLADFILRGWQRFDLPSLLGGNVVREEDRKRLEAAVLLYRRFANGTGPHRNYRHALLLWLQRAYMQDKFEETPALPGSDDETPYDFDHICPANHWSDWTGTIKKPDPDRIIDFTMEKSAEQWLGNSIGNVRVWDSSDNRSLSDIAPDKRLETVEDRNDSVVNDNEGWEGCGSGCKWSRDRAIAFQRAIEARTINLYKKLYEDLDFAAYVDIAAGHGGIT